MHHTCVIHASYMHHTCITYRTDEQQTILHVSHDLSHQEQQSLQLLQLLQSLQSLQEQQEQQEHHQSSSTAGAYPEPDSQEDLPEAHPHHPPSTTTPGRACHCCRHPVWYW